VNVQNVSVAENASIPAPSLIASVSNPSSDNVNYYAFWDGGTGNGHFTLNGTTQPDGQWIVVAASNLSSIQYVGGASPGSEDLYVDIYDATTGTWSNYGSLTATTTAPHAAPTVNVQNVSVAENASIVASSLITSVSNPNGDNISEYAFWDGGTGNGHFTVSSATQPDGEWVIVNASNLSSIQYVGGASPGNEPLYVTLYDATIGTWSNYGSLTATTTGTTGTIAIATIQNDYLAITRTALFLDQATTAANAINAGTTTETQYVNSLLSQVADTAIPAVAVEASMYGAVGSSVEVTLLTTQFLPAQVALALQNGFNPLVFASEVLGVVFASSNETGSTAFATAFGPTHAGMPNSVAGDDAFAAAAVSAIFGSASTSNLVSAMESYIFNWKTFFTNNGLHGNADQVDLAARGTAWGDLVGVALANPSLSPLSAQAINFLEDAAQGTAIYSASLSSQPNHAPFQGAATASVATTASHVQLTGVAAPIDHIIG
jgi:hypothetical protein